MFDWEKDGLCVIKNAFTPLDLEQFEKAVYRLAMKKLEEQQDFPYGLDTVTLLQEIERKYPWMFYEICSQVGGTLAGLRLLAGDNIRGTLGNAFADPESLLPAHPVLFWNDRKVKRLQYDWHQECSYFNGQPRGAHLWFPLFEDTTHDNGPMLAALGSHKARYPYRYSKDENALTQLVPEIDVMGTFDIAECVLSRGDAILFHHNLIHCTGENLTDRPRVSGIIRFVDGMASQTWQPMMGFVFKEEVKALVMADGIHGTDDWDGTGPLGA